MRVIVYVEGISDKLALEVLLHSLIFAKMQQGILIEFFETPDGDRKASVLTKVPVKAVNTLRNDANAIVIAIPDLYPKNRAFPHETFEEMKTGILKNYEAALKSKGLQADARLRDRFQVFCFKHDLEALVLAAEEALKGYLGIEKFPLSWTKPVEDQNHNTPPKRIVEQIFHSCSRNYVGVIDTPLILAMADYKVVAERCTQCFKPFIDFIAGL